MAEEALRRVLRQEGEKTLELLAELPGADLTTLLLEAMRLRARRLSTPGLLRRYREDRFVSPASIPFHHVRRVEDSVLSVLPPEFEVLNLAPVVPLGTHSVVATVDQNKVVSTVRGSEVAADPTNALALEAADRRSRWDRERLSVPVRLAALQRVVRAQRFGQAGFAHFTLLGLVTAGRDTGNLAFERQHAAEHLRFAVDALRACAEGDVEVRLTLLDPRFEGVTETIRDALSGRASVVDDADRNSGGYYAGLCFKVYRTGDGEPFEIGDGGFVEWTRSLLADRKERLLISGLGIERLVSVTPDSS
jgi:hypothetical protein